VTSEISLFINPTAGRGRGGGAAPPAARALRDAGYRVKAVVGGDAGDALCRARAEVAAGTGALIAVGGDGMVSLALQAVAGTGVPLGVIAVGTGNDFARTLGLPVRRPEAAARLAAEALKAGELRAVDLGRVPAPGADGADGRWFGTVLASGFDSRVNDRGNRMRWPAGRLKYDLATLAELASFRPIGYRLRLDDGPWRELEATLVAVGNGTSYGGGMRICADALTDDGLFDVTVVGDCGRATLLRVFPRVYRGTHLAHPQVTSYRAARITLEAPGITGYADGERVGPLPLTAECRPAAVRVLAPPP
jgi:diacylglycerol kinase (ATP)